MTTVLIEVIGYIFIPNPRRAKFKKAEHASGFVSISNQF